MLSENPLLAVDGAHNAASAEVLRAAIEKYLSFERLHLVLGLSAGKDTHGMFRDKDWKYYEAGAIGFGVKTLVDLCERFRDPLA